MELVKSHQHKHFEGFLGFCLFSFALFGAQPSANCCIRCLPTSSSVGRYMGQREECGNETLHHRKTRKDSYLNRKGLRHEIEISIMHEREISQKCQWLSLLKLTQKMWFGTRRPVSLLNSCISYPNLYFPPCLQENTKCFSIQYFLLLKAVRELSLHAYLRTSHL